MPKCFDTSYLRGEFFQFLLAPSMPRAEEFVSSRGFWGLDLHKTYPYGCVRTDDGQMFEILRVIPTDKGAKDIYPTLLIQSTELDGQNLQFDMAKTKDVGSSFGCVPFVDGDTAVWRKAAEVPGCDWEIRVSEKTFSWVEDGLFSFKGPMLNPGCQWLLPGPDFGTFYVNYFAQLEGEILGRKARGVISFDQSYWVDGAKSYVNKDIMVNNKGHILWYMWGTGYDDGSAEWGQYIVGNDRMDMAFYANSEGEVRTTFNVDAKVNLSEEDPDSPFTGRIDMTMDGEEWEFLPDPRGKMPGMYRKHPPTPQQEGRWQRKGEKRKPIAWFAWGETEREHGLQKQPFLPTRKK